MFLGLPYLQGNGIEGGARGVVAGPEEHVAHAQLMHRGIVQLQHADLKAVVGGAPVVVRHPVLHEDSMHGSAGALQRTSSTHAMLENASP